ncbi:4'-phosphopantetheinyl transferase superfamily protein [Paenibacillus albidus]|uniref:4'-phosphopantetheinyl transferase family protein n=1 Tax=Paenibacillus albidus TaxID=2041023 RepID=UPI001BE805A1|nr:4'-phosphopantetheinyl transferase superfamily protein [Paenibacillus albidus]MBT2291745.1 4'-phosphopantetheinyl transferase superfamily protein [Paenibacillus albidus]
MSKIIALKLPEQLSPESYAYFTARVSKARRERLTRFIHIKDAYRSLFGEILVRYILCGQFGQRNGHIQFEQNPFGKPGVSGQPDFEYNVSHSGDWVLMIWGTNEGALGVDVEQIKPIDLEVAERFFSVEEKAALKSKPAGEQLEFFYDLWTLKESYIKAIGTGLSRPLDSFTVQQRKDGGFSLITEGELMYFQTYTIAPTYKAAACSSCPALPGSASFIELNELYFW